MSQIRLPLPRRRVAWTIYVQPLCERARCRCGRTFSRHIDAPDGTLCPRCEPPRTIGMVAGQLPLLAGGER